MESRIAQCGRAALLFVRSEHDILRAVEAVNQLLSQRRARGTRGDEVLGLVVRANIDSGILNPTFAGARFANAPVEAHESVSLGGVWSLCWFDISSVEGDDAHERRKRLLDVLSLSGESDCDNSTGACVFFPVLTPTEAQHETDAVVDELRVLYPTLLVRSGIFVRDSASGALAPAERVRPRLRLVRSA